MKDNRLVLFILVVALLYIISLVDLMPDVVPVVGWIDDTPVGKSKTDNGLTYHIRSLGPPESIVQII